MRIGIFEAVLLIFLYVFLLYNLNILILKNISHISKNFYDIKTNAYDDVFWDKSVNRNLENRKCFRLLWNLSEHDEISTNVPYQRNQIFSSIFNIQSKSCNRFITIGKSCGRMGNQMFQVASVIGIAFKYDMIPVIPKKMLYIYFDLPNTYDTNHHQLEKSTNCSCIKTAAFHNCQETWNSTVNVSMRGLLQSWKYFIDARHIIKNIFTIKRDHIENAKKFMSNSTKNGYQHVCIHVRRGDFLNTYKQYYVPDASFIQRAMSFYVKTFKTVDFILVSQDKLWCRENIKNVPISPFINAADDMALMMLSDHVIVTAGTFGWWGAWLSGGLTVYSKEYPGRNMSHKFNIPDYYPSYWIGL